MLDLMDDVSVPDGERLPLLTEREARAAVQLLRHFAETGGSGAEAAGHLAAALARRLPSGA
ncbi:hypothetical protein [Streptomyces sp. NPDC000404]